MTLTRRSLFGVAGAAGTFLGFGQQAPESPAAEKPSDKIAPSDEVIDFAKRFSTEILPKKLDHFSTDTYEPKSRKVAKKGNANQFDYNCSGQSFYVTALDRILQVIHNCLVKDEAPSVGVADQWSWQAMLAIVSEMAKAHPVLALEMLQHMDVRCPWLYLYGIPFFRDEYLTKMQAHVVYIVNPASLSKPPDPSRRLNGIIMNTKKC